jgi:DNA helicase HerA-like ATPase
LFYVAKRWQLVFIVIPDEALRSDIAILGKKGRGKSYAAKGLVERLLDLGERVLILDPLGHWWGLKSSADGERPGYAVAVFGGEHADIAITEESGRVLAQILAAETIPAIVDMGAMRKGEQQRLVADLLDELFARNRALDDRARGSRRLRTAIPDGRRDPRPL